MLLVSFLASCSMERIPATAGRRPVHVENSYIKPCHWHSFPETSTPLIPSVKNITCELIGGLSTETMEFSFTETLGTIQAKHSRKLALSFELTTGENGAIYFLEYEPRKGIHECIGRWCGWSNSLDPPSLDQLLPDEEGNVLVKSDGGIVYRAIWNSNLPLRGLAIIYCGLGGMQHSSKVLGNELMENGWAIVYLYTVLNAPDYKTNIALDKKPFVDTIIDLFDKKYCQVISATKAIRSHIEQQLPQLTSLPLILVGISAGALNTPAVYHEIKNNVDAVVLIAGGANMFDIVQKGAFTKWKFTHDFVIPFTEDELHEIERNYLNTPSRDPYYLAPELPRNTLLVHAKWDEVVPAENGDLLWQRAGKPERWIYPSGHLGLFATFGWHANDIVEWINDKIN